jgi:hypothetical protein
MFLNFGLIFSVLPLPSAMVGTYPTELLCQFRRIIIHWCSINYFVQVIMQPDVTPHAHVGVDVPNQEDATTPQAPADIICLVMSTLMQLNKAQSQNTSSTCAVPTGYVGLVEKRCLWWDLNP